VDEVEFHMQDTDGIIADVQLVQTLQMGRLFKYQVNELILYTYVRVMLQEIQQLGMVYINMMRLSLW
jgi:hypothetical protein